MKRVFTAAVMILCVLSANAQENKEETATLTDKVWECYSYIRAFKTDIKLSSRDIYYANKVYEIQPTISVKVPATYSNEVT
ncbi:MAG: hypothetical protein LBP40_06690, partial [Campylobacteraceae bacterium]|nr:hypothetical protein [Campylobacteraceae bacterium]